MAAWLNKWFSFTVISGFLLLPGEYGLSDFSTTHPGAGGAHPLHVSVIEINHNATDKTLEISCKIFTDDFEKILARNYKTKVDLTHPRDKAAMDTLVKKYLGSHLSIKTNGKPASFFYLGYEIDHEAVYAYIEVPNVPTVSKFDLSASIMYDQFEDQMNIFHVIVDGKRKSTKLNYPDKEAVISF